MSSIYVFIVNKAMQLRDYDDVIDPVDAHSLIALTACSNKAFGVCSKVSFFLNATQCLLSCIILIKTSLEIMRKSD